jgi:FHA domain
MEQLTTRISIEPGSGLVGRFGDTVIVIPRGGPGGPASAGTVQELLGLAAEVASDRQAPASAIASRLAGWVISHMSGDAPAFGIVAPMRDGVVMFLRGPVWCTITDGGATREVSGEQALTWVDQIVPGTFDRLAIGSVAGLPVQADPLSDLRSGVVPGQGFMLSRAVGVPGLSGAEPALAESAPGAAAVGPGGSGSGGFAWSPSEERPGPATDRSQDARALRAEPSDDQPEPPDLQPETPDYQPEAADYQPEPAGYQPEPSHHQPTMIARPGEHEMTPGQDEPAPAPAVQPTTVNPMPPRPTAAPQPVGVLTSQDAPPIILDRVYVLGREPRQDPAVESGEAEPVQLQDPDHVISRVHAYVAVENGIVLVRDADSMHGTYFSPPGGEEWTRIGTEPSPLPPGWNVQIGPQVFTFEAAEPGHDR